MNDQQYPHKPLMTDNLMHIKSEAKSEGIIYKDTRYVRFSFFDDVEKATHLLDEN